MCAPLLDRSWYKQVRVQQESAGRHSLLTCRRTNFSINSKLLSVHAYASVTAVLTAMVSVILLPCPFSLINFIESCSMGGKSHSGPRDAGGIFVWFFWVPRSSSAEGHYTLAAIAWVQITILRPNSDYERGYPLGERSYSWNLVVPGIWSSPHPY